MGLEFLTDQGALAEKKALLCQPEQGPLKRDPLIFPIFTNRKEIKLSYVPQLV